LIGDGDVENDLGPSIRHGPQQKRVEQEALSTVVAASFLGGMFYTDKVRPQPEKPPRKTGDPKSHEDLDASHKVKFGGGFVHEAEGGDEWSDGGLEGLGEGSDEIKAKQRRKRLLQAGAIAAVAGVGTYVLVDSTQKSSDGPSETPDNQVYAQGHDKSSSSISAAKAA
jgi:hypothetical protein